MVAHGSPSNLVQLGEILAWLGAACWASSCTNDIEYCAPSISISGFGSGSVNACKIRFIYEKTDVEDLSLPRDDLCWQKLFLNPAITKGYPVNYRKHNEKGIEIPIQMAAAVSHAQWVTTFGGLLVLKGVCSALIPVARFGSSIIWHYYINEDGKRISYDDILKQKGAQGVLNLSSILSFKHFVGWTPEAHVMIGTHLRSSSSVYDSLVWF